MEHGVPQMRSKWVHHQWAHQGGEQGKDSRPADGPPHLPHGNRTRTASTTTTKDRMAFRGHPQPGDDAEVPGTRTPGRRPGSPPGSSLRTGEEDKLASSFWKLLEDLGAKKMEAPRGDTVGKGVSLCPPALQKVGDRT